MDKMQFNKYEMGLDKNDANYVSLSPLTFIEWAASVFPNRPSLIHGGERYTWKETYARCRRLASALDKHGIGKGDTVAVIAPNIPRHFEAHFGVPVVARPDEQWGEIPCAFVTLKPDARSVTKQDIIDFCRRHLAHFKCPKTVFFTELPKTSTGKIQKFVLRDWAKAL